MAAPDPAAGRPPSPVRRLLDGLYLASGVLSGLFLVAMFLVMLALSAGRPLGIDVPAADDFTSWCMGATAFLGLAHTFRSGEFIRMTLLTGRLPAPLRHGADIAATAVGLAATGYLAWYAVDMTVTSFVFNDLSQGVVAVPLWIPELGFAAGTVILAIAFADELVHLCRGGAPRFEKPAPATDEEKIERILQEGA